MVGLGASGLASFTKELMNASESAGRLFDAMDSVEYSVPVLVPMKPEIMQGRVDFEDVYFSYPSRPTAQVIPQVILFHYPKPNPDSTAQVLKGFSFSLEPGKVWPYKARVTLNPDPDNNPN